MTKFQQLLRRVMRFSIPNLMTYIVIGQILVFVLDYVGAATGFVLSPYLILTRSSVLQGQIWRLLTFIFVPESSNLALTALSLYVYWIFGSGLESRWGSARFTCFYLFGIIGSILAGMLLGIGTTYYLNLSLILAYAILEPDEQMLLFFILPVKLKYVALFDAALILYYLVVNPWFAKIAILLSLMNLILFLGGDLINTLRDQSRYWKTRRNFRKAVRR